MNRVELKTKAKNILKGNWGQAISLLLLYGLISFGAGIVVNLIGEMFRLTEQTANILGNIADIVVSAFFTLGTTSFYLKLSRGEEATYKELFSKTDMFVVALLAIVLISIFTTLWTLLLIIPGIIAAINYSQTYYILVDDKTKNAYDAIKASKEMMKGHKWDYFVLVLSFSGWMILATLTLGIGFIWLVPYMQVTFANFYDSIKA